MAYKVYKHSFSDGRFYIGTTSLNVNDRWKNGMGYRDNKEFFCAILAEGWDNMLHEVIEDGIESKEEALKRETYWIHYYIREGWATYNKQKVTIKQKIITVYYCPELGVEARTLKEMGELCGISYERVRQLLNSNRKTLKGGLSFISKKVAVGAKS